MKIIKSPFEPRSYYLSCDADEQKELLTWLVASDIKYNVSGFGQISFYDDESELLFVLRWA